MNILQETIFKEIEKENNSIIVDSLTEEDVEWLYSNGFRIYCIENKYKITWTDDTSELVKTKNKWKLHNKNLISNFKLSLKDRIIPLKILFLNDNNGHESADPCGILCSIFNDFDVVKVKKIEHLFYNRFSGTVLSELLNNLGFTYEILSSKKYSQYDNKDYSIIYTLMSGNY